MNGNTANTFVLQFSFNDTFIKTFNDVELWGSVIFSLCLYIPGAGGCLDHQQASSFMPKFCKIGLGLSSTLRWDTGSW